MEAKEFDAEIEKLYSRFLEGAPFCFSKYADGEWAIMTDNFLNNKEFEVNSKTPRLFKQKLIESIQFKDPNYHIGTCCPCCNGDDAEKMRLFSGQNEANMTFANIFVNTNYKRYKETFLKSYENYDVHLVANLNSKIENLPFKVEKFYPVGFNAWVDNYSLIEDIKQEKLSNKLFLFCAGPFGNMLAHQLYKNNKNNIYLDIGSTLNPWLQSEGFKRDYYIGGYFSEKKCIWKK